MAREINDKQKRMIDLYVSNGYNLKKAYLEAYGIADREGISHPYQIIKRPEVKAYLEQRRSEIYESLQVDAMRITSELATMAFAPKGDKYYNAQIKLQALNTLSKNMGLQTQKVENKDVIEVNITSDQDETEHS